MSKIIIIDDKKKAMESEKRKESINRLIKYAETLDWGKPEKIEIDNNEDKKIK